LEGGAVPSDLLRDEVPGGESLTGFLSRVFAALNQLPKPEDERPPLIVAHAGTWYALCRWMNVDTATLWPPNATPTLLERP
jgi:probable phosphoglycerate mutase